MFESRRETGKLLVQRLKKLQDEKRIIDPVVVAIPRGGVVVGAEIAKELNVPLDLLFVKKIPAPNNEKLTIGSISENGLVFLNQALVNTLDVDENYLQEKGIEKIQEMARLRDKYKHEPILLEDKDVILVDDGIATGASMYLAAQSIVRDRPRSVIIAAPVMLNDDTIINTLKSVSHHMEILKTADNFMSVSKWYEDFHQLSDKEVKDILKEFQ